MKRIFLIFVFGSMLVLAQAGMVYAEPSATFIVNSTDDDKDRNPGDGKCDASLLPGDECTLRAAIMETNALSGTDTISIPAGTYVLTRKGYDEFAEKGDLDIRASVNIVGASAASTIIDGNGKNTDDRVFDLRIGTINIERVTIRGGHTQGNNIPGCCYEYGKGGGVAVRAGVNATFTKVILRANKGLEAPGALSNDGTLTLNQVTSSENCGDEAHSALRNDGTMTITNSTLINVPGTALCGGTTDGLLSLGTVSLTNSTSTSLIEVTGFGNLRNVTAQLIRNEYLSGGNDFNYGTGVIGAFNSIIAVCGGALQSLGYNLIHNNSCAIGGNLAGNLIGVDPLLGSLQNNGGATFTRQPLGLSPAIDAGNPSGCVFGNNIPLTTDQRGFPRPTDGNGAGGAQCDIGAFEVGAVGIGSISPNNGSSMPGEYVLFDVAWDSPTRWRDLNTVDLRFKRGKQRVLWLRFTEGLPNSAFSILDKHGNVKESGNVGEAKILNTRFGALDLSQSGFTASGPNDPHVVLHYVVKFKPKARGKLKMQMLATDDFANEQGPERGGMWKVKP